MVTGAIWVDLDGNQSPDLVLTEEWGPVRIFINSKGTLREYPSTASGLSKLQGWWNSIAGGDFDGDGDTDFVVTNFGLNHKYHASVEKPALIHFGDFDGSGKPRIIEAEFEGSICYPIRGRSCSTRAMPALGKRFKNYEAFAVASLEEIYTASRLEDSLKLEATTLTSGILINNTPTGGSPKFEFQALPRLAQIAPAFDVATADLNGDGILDLALAQNFFGPQPETGRMDGGLSLVLLGNGDGTFRELWPLESGVSVPGDAKSVSCRDVNADQIPDLIFGINGVGAQVFLGNPKSK